MENITMYSSYGVPGIIVLFQLSNRYSEFQKIYFLCLISKINANLYVKKTENKSLINLLVKMKMKQWGYSVHICQYKIIHASSQ